MNFRWKAMQKMREPDELDAPMTLAAPRGWIAVMVLLVVTIAAVVWVFVGELPVNVSAPGLLTTPGGTASVQTPWAGTVTDLPVRLGQHIAAGAEVAALRTADGTARTLTSQFAGTVVGLGVSVGQVVASGARMAFVERTDAPNDEVVAMLFVTGDNTSGLHAGTSVDLSVSSAPAGQYGLLRGRVSSVSPYPLTSGQLDGLVGGPLAARKYFKAGPPLLVLVHLTRDSSTKSGYAWSTKSGPPFRPQTQDAVTGTIEVHSQTPFNLLFGR